MRRLWMVVALAFWSAALGAATFTVTTTADSGAGSLRQAVLNANASPGADTITFAIGTGPQMITLTSASINITEAVVVDGQTQPGFTGTPIIELNGNNATIFCFNVSSTGTTLRGLVINRFGREGMTLSGSSHVIEGNYIGTDVTGSVARANSGGIRIDGGTNIRIGGTSAAARNLISGNTGFGIGLSTAATTGITIQGNYIGTNVTGTAALGNGGVGVSVANGATNITIGGTTSAARNVISGNRSGVVIASAGTGNVVQGNYIGTDVNGTSDLGNTQGGVEILDTSSQPIGGTTAGAGNLISGNNFSGILIQGAMSPTTSNVVAGNLIGTNAAGTAAIPNGDGVYITNATSNTVGGLVAGARNVISGNQNNGIFFSGSANDNIIQGNFIGTDINGTAALGNGMRGIDVNSGSRIAIGGTAAGAGNRIRFNGTGGFRLQFGTQNAIRRNSFGNHSALGIDLHIAGVTPNDSGDADSGGNNVQNFPVIATALITAGTTIVSGTLNSTPSTTFDIELFDNAACNPSGNGEGLTFAAATTVTTDAAGNASFSVTVPSSLNIVTATATDPNGNTSEFSACRTAGVSLITINDVDVTEGNSGTTTATFTVTASPTPTVVTTVQYATASSSATAPADYLSTSGTLTFNPGESSKTIAVTVNGDVIDELNESFFVNLTNATNAAIADSQGVGTITDDDTATASVNDVTVIEGSPAVFTITLSTPSAFTEFVDFATQNGTAVAPGDYTTTIGTAIFAPGETTKTVSVPTIIDTTTEIDETFTLTITTNFFPAVGDGTGVGTIRDISFIPALSTWMLMLLAVVLGGMGALLLRR